MKIPTTMIGLCKTEKGPGNLALREVPVPRPRPNEVLIEIKAAGVCGTDIHIWHDKFPYWPPVIMGHEFSGVIVAVGAAVSDYQVGERVVAEPHTLACGKCALCRTGHIQLCTEKRSPGWGIDGSFARYLPMPEHLLHRIPDTLTYEAAALVEPTANVVQDVIERGQVEPNDKVVVLGPGPIGLLAVMAAKAAGAQKVILVGSPADAAVRLPMGVVMGADELIVADQDDVVDQVMDLTDGLGAEVVVEASGAPAAIALTPHLVRRLGRITAIGMTGGQPVEFPWDTAIWKVCTVIFNLSTGYTSWEKTIGLMAVGLIQPAKIITHQVPLAKWEALFAQIEARQVVKALLIP